MALVFRFHQDLFFLYLFEFERPLDQVEIVDQTPALELCVPAIKVALFRTGWIVVPHRAYIQICTGL
jgi:hypothetical protein